MEQATEKQVKFMKNLNIEIPEGMTKAEARLAIDRVLTKDKEEKPEVVKPGKPANNHATMYTSYAKDIFCIMIGDPEKTKETMNKSIELVKQAKAAFE